MMRPSQALSADDQDSPARRKSTSVPLSMSGTSPLSPSLSLSDLQAGEGENAEELASAHHSEDTPSVAQDEATVDEAEANHAVHVSSAADRTQPYQCRQCQKPCASWDELQKHIRGGRSKCWRERNGEWFCPRCRQRFTAKKGVLRHIAVTCWKICDECCASGYNDCDASHLGVGATCSNCTEDGKSCSQHTAAIADCPSPQKIVAGGEHANAASSLATAPPTTTQPPQRRATIKRRVSLSPENSPESRPQPKKKRGRPSKRSIAATEDVDSLNALGDEDNLAVNHPAGIKKSGRPRKRPVVLPEDDNDSLVDEVFGPKSPAPGQPLHRSNRPLPNSMGALSAPAGISRHTPLAVLPPLDGRDIEGIANGTRHVPDAQEQMERRRQLQARGQPAQYGHTTQELLDRQRQSSQNIQLMQQHMAGHGTGTYPAPVVSSARSSLHMGQNAFDLVPPGRNGQDGRRSALRGEISIHEDQVPDPFSAPGYPPFAFSNPGSHVPSRVPSRVPSVVGDRLSAPGSRAPSRQPSPNHLDAALTGIGSRFPSRAASSDLRRPSLHRSSDEEAMQDHGHANREPKDQFAVSHEVPPELDQELSIPSIVLQSQTPSPSNPTIRLRISSNTYDPTGALIFSILTMRMHDPFGPRLEYYCTQRGKRLGIDWKIIFKYPAPTPSDPKRKRAFDLHHLTTPHMCFDKEYPTARLRDGDTLLVCRRRSPADDSVDKQLGTQLDVERIEIENGERPTFQGEDVNVAWYRDVEAEISVLKQQAAASHAMAQRYAVAHTESWNAARGLGVENEGLRARVGALESELVRRQGSVLHAQNAESVWQQTNGQQHGYQHQLHGMPDTPTPQQRGRPSLVEQGEGVHMPQARRSANSAAMFGYEAPRHEYYESEEED